ncbi:MAG: DUF2779 domain-containing protein, partial [Eggerthellaceae bacterium]|nr:DUF2779 domain-containing protein [Eggerthellaceae bacterium]
MRFSKSRYVAGLRCPKILWMNRRMPEQFDSSVRRERLIGEGAAVRELARGYYGECAEVPFDSGDFEGMAERTRELLDAGAPAICGATFIRDGLFCMVDVLLAEGDGVRVVSVKASNSVKRFHLDGASYQLHVVEGCGLKVKGVGLMHLNPGYRRAGEIDLRGLFVVEDVTQEARRLAASVPANLERIAREAGGDAEPGERIGRRCDNPYPCGYRAWCKRTFPSPSVFDISGMRGNVASRLAYGRGVVAMGNVAESGVALTRRQAVQVACEVEGREAIADPGAVRAFLGDLRFPLCFLDFETLCEAVPRFDGCGPWQQVPYQYSLHVLEDPGG